MSRNGIENLPEALEHFASSARFGLAEPDAMRRLHDLAKDLGAWCDPAAPIGRAVISALLDPARVREECVSVPFELSVMGQMAANYARRARRPGPGTGSVRDQVA